MKRSLVSVILCMLAFPALATAQELAPGFGALRPDSTIKAIVDRLSLDLYKANVKGLTQFGDRRQGTDRNRAAVDWIEAQLKSFGCTNTERIKYTYSGRQVRNDSTNRVDSIARAAAGTAPNGRGRGAGANGGRGAGGRGGLTNPPKYRPRAHRREHEP